MKTLKMSTKQLAPEIARRSNWSRQNTSDSIVGCVHCLTFAVLHATDMTLFGSARVTDALVNAVRIARVLALVISGRNKECFERNGTKKTGISLILRHYL